VGRKLSPVDMDTLQRGLSTRALWYIVAEPFPTKNGHQNGHQTQGRQGKLSDQLLVSVLVSIFRPNGVDLVDFRDFRDFRRLV
jgi:hypothetical protein